MTESNSSNIRGRPARTLLVCALMTVAAILPAKPARAASTSYVFSGGGWGHGLGLSQYGALGQAAAGRNYREILTHYYQNTKVATATMPAVVRVGVTWDVTSISFSATDSAEVRYRSPGGELVRRLGSGEPWRVATGSSGSFLLINSSGSIVATRAGGANKLFVAYGGPGQLRVAGHYHEYGVLELNTYYSSGRWWVRGIITGLSMKAYLYGLGEMPSGWKIHALYAQSTAAATYAAEKIARTGQHRSGCNCALYASTFDQVFVGYDKISGYLGERWKKAVDDTAGRAVVSSSTGKLIEAYYHSTSGGHTEHNENVWGGSPRSYLRGVRDPWDKVSPLHTWRVVFTPGELQNLLNSYSDTRIGTLYGIETLPPYGISGRVLSPSESGGGVRIRGSDATRTVSGTRIRRTLGLRDTLFRILRSGLHPNGTLVKRSTGATYRVETGRLRRVPTSRVRADWGDGDEVIGVDDASLLRYDGPHAGFRDGKLVRTPNGTVWFISHGRRRAFSSEEVFTGLGYQAEDVLDVTNAEAAWHPVGAPVTSTSGHPDGTLLRAGAATAPTWYREAGKLRRVTSPLVYESRFHKGETVVVDVLPPYPKEENNPLGFRDGTLIRTPSNAIYVVSNTKRRHITSAAVFKGLGYAGSNIVEVSDALAALHSEGPDVASAAAHPDGTVLKGSLPMRFLLKGRGRRLLDNDKVLTSHGIEVTEVVKVPDSKLAGYRTGSPSRGFRDGTLIRTPEGSTFIISRGERRAFISGNVFRGLGYSGSNIVYVTSAEASLHPKGPAVRSTYRHPDGSIIRNGSKVFYIEQGLRRPIISGRVLASQRFSPEEILDVSLGKMQSYDLGAALGFRNGSLLRSPGGTIYAISDGKRRPFPSAAVFLAMGYRSVNVVTVGWTELGLHPPGKYIG